MSDKLWCFLVPGPDDLWAMPSKEVAEERAAKHNEFVRKSGLSAQTCISENQLFAQVMEWPYSADEHAEALLNPETAWLPPL